MALISELDINERPREKALSHGIGSLTDAELLALLFGTGIRGMSAIELSQHIIDAHNRRLSYLARLTPQELMRQFKGIGQAKAVTVAAALELGRRACEDAAKEQKAITCSADIDRYMRQQLQLLDHEQFWVLHLSRAGKVIYEQCVSRGGVTFTAVDIRIIMQKALQVLASSIVLVHNHPSGNVAPSAEDDRLTRRIADAGKTLDIKVLDHVIIGVGDYYSYIDSGRM